MLFAAALSCWLSRVLCKIVFSTERNFANSLHRYCSAPLSILLFCLGLGWFFTVINQLQKLQNRASRITTNSSFSATSWSVVEGPGWKTIVEIITCESNIMVFMLRNKLAPQYLCDLFTRNSQCSSYSLRNSRTDFRLPMKRSTNCYGCFSYRGAKLFGCLSAKWKPASALYSFKKTI